MSGLEELCNAARKRMGATKAIRLKAARERSIEFNRKAEADFEAQRVTPELLAKTCTL
uniref:Uncharacterized protein n=1 Tax=Pseudomonas phage RVTF4 TaxID=3236931 RepID=A0AB39CCI0_9VIRU